MKIRAISKNPHHRSLDTPFTAVTLTAEVNTPHDLDVLAALVRLLSLNRPADMLAGDLARVAAQEPDGKAK